MIFSRLVSSGSRSESTQMSSKVLLIEDDVPLTRTVERILAFELLLALARNAGRVTTADALAHEASRTDESTAVQSVKPYFHYLRKKIEDDATSPRRIQTVRAPATASPKNN